MTKLGLTSGFFILGLSLVSVGGCYGGGGGHHSTGGAGGTTSSGGSGNTSSGGSGNASSGGSGNASSGGFGNTSSGGRGGSVSSGGSGAVASGGTGNVGGSPCDQALTVAENCGLISVAPHDCVNDHTTQCQASCFVNATCTELQDALCNDMANAFVSCLISCPTEQLPCGDGTTYPPSYECDGFSDCASGVDEADCDFPCGDGSTVPADYRCDGFTDCASGADEANCATLNCGL